MNLHSVGIVTALAAEARTLTQQPLRPRQLIALGDGCGLWLSGMGPEAAHEAAIALVDAGATALAVFGVAGALAPGVRNGTLLCPACVIDERGNDYHPTPAWREALQQCLAASSLPFMAGGSLLSLPQPLLDAGAKMAMRQRHMAVAVDMESAAVAAVASERKLPFVVLRAIIDEHDDDIPAALQAGIDAWGRPRPLNMLALLGRHPGLLAHVPGLSRRMRGATRALRLAATAAGMNLGRAAQGSC